MNALKTYHASIVRLSSEEIIKQSKIFTDNKLLESTFNSFNVSILIINKERQIIYANNVFLRTINAELIEVLGIRPGEALNCIHAEDNIGGCGTAISCRHCNAVNTILRSISSGNDASGEVTITYSKEKKGVVLPLNILEHVKPYFIDNELFYIVTLMDISDSVRKRQLERVFYHDILNTLGGLKGLIGLLNEEVEDDLKEDIEVVKMSVSSVLDEIDFHKKLNDAENDELKCKNEQASSKEIINTIKNIYSNHDICRHKNIQLSIGTNENVNFISCNSLLLKVLGNMIKNAIEASSRNSQVTISSNIWEDYILFSVHNDGYMEEKIKEQIFNRSFSTKGKGRGLGTYSMKLFAEKYLEGKVYFESSRNSGTTFYLKIYLDNTYKMK